MRTAMDSYSEALVGDAEAMAYLTGPRRGLTEETIRTHRLGVVVEPEPAHIKFKGMIAIPYLGPHGDPVAIRFHCFEEHDHRALGHGKYNTMYGDSARLYNARLIAEPGLSIHVTEGEFDAMILNQIGLPAVAAPGGKSWKRHHRIMLAGYSFIWTWGDPDETGAEFNQKIAKSLSQARSVRLPGGDITDLYTRHGQKYVEGLLEQAKRKIT